MNQFHKDSHKDKFKRGILIASSFLGIIWVIHLIQWFTPLSWSHYGILPLRYEGLKGIFLSPFLHSQEDFGHIINNSTTLFAGIIMLYYFYSTVANRVLVFIYLFTGVAVWIIAGLFVESRYAYHIGASGVVYGLISFVFWSGIFRKNARSIILSLIIILMYSGMVVGLFPDAEGKISWQSHVAGAIFGMILAFQYKNVIEWDELQSYEQKASFENDAPKERFFPPDIFEKTKQERWLEEEIKRQEELLKINQEPNNVVYIWKPKESPPKDLDNES